MTIEQQVCSADQAISLQKLGVEQKALFYWQMTPDVQENIVNSTYRHTIEKILPGCNLFYAAFTVAELGVMLGDLEGLVCYCPNEDRKWLGELGSDSFDTEAQAKANLLINLLESEDEYVNSTVVNERLSS